MMMLFLLSGGCRPRTGEVLFERYSFDEQDRITSYTSPMGDKTTMNYYKSGNLQEVNYPEGVANYGYDENGNRIWMNDHAGITEYYYDAFDRLIAVITEHSPRFITLYRYDHRNSIVEIGIIKMDELSFNYEYQDLMRELNQRFQLNLQKHRERQQKLSQLTNRLRNETYERQFKLYQYHVKYQYDAFNRLTEINNKGERISYIYNIEQQRVIRKLPNNIQTVFSFSSKSELLSVRHETYQGNLLNEFVYRYDFAGRISEITEHSPGSSKTIQYEWNHRNLLGSEHHSDGSQIRYEYDPKGRLIMKYTPQGDFQYKYDKFERLIQAGNFHFRWNKNNFLIVISGENVNTRFAYNSWGEVVKIETLETSIQFQYDGDGNRISYSYYDRELIYTIPNPLDMNDSPLMEFRQNGDIRNSYLYGYGLTGQINETGESEYFLEGADGLFNQIVDLNGEIITYVPEIFDFINKSISTAYLKEILKNTVSRNVVNNIGLIAASPRLGFMFSMADPTTKHIGRLIYQGGPFITEEDKQEYFSAATGLLVVKLLGVTSPPVVIAIATSIGISLAIKFISVEAPKFLGSRWGRPESILSSLWWMPQKDYLNLIEEQAKEQALSAGLANMRRQSNEKNSDSNISLNIGNQLTEEEDEDRKFWPINYHLFFFPPGPPGPPDGNGDNGNGDNGNGDNGNGGNGGPPTPIWDFVSQHSEVPNKDPINLVEQRLGGIELSVAAEFRGSPGNITAAVYDPEREYLVLVGEKDYSVAEVKPEDFAVAMALTFGLPEQDAQFSLDPADPKNPKGKWLKAVYMPESILAGTYFGDALFEADWLLKQYSFGVYIDENNMLQPRQSLIPGYKHTAELCFEREKEDNENILWARYWIVSDKMIIQESENSITFDEAKMAVNARRQVVDLNSPTGLSDVPTGPDEIPSVYARQFTRLYDDFAKEEPAFERLTELAKTVALVKWLKKERIPVDREWIMEFIDRRKEYVDQVAALNYQWNKENQRTYHEANRVITETSTHSIHLFGGIDLTVNPEYRIDDGRTALIRKTVIQHIDDGITDPEFEFTVNGQKYSASVAPFTGKGGQLWQERITGLTRIPGTNYDFSDEGKLLKEIDKDGTTTEYGYNENGNLNQINILYYNGAQIEYQKNDTGSSWLHIKPNGRTIGYNYDNKGYMTNITVDGELYATYSYNLTNRQIVSHYPGYSEILNSDNSGNNIKHEIRILAPGSASEYVSSKFEYRYNSRGNIIHISGDGFPPVDIVYADNDEQIVIMTTSDLTTEYFYDDQERLLGITRSDGYNIKYLYGEGENLIIQVEEENQKMEYIFDENGLRRYNILGEIVDYDYENGNPVSIKSNQFGHIRFSYDKNNYLRQLQFPDGPSIVCNYLLQNILIDGIEQTTLRQLQINTYPSDK